MSVRILARFLSCSLRDPSAPATLFQLAHEIPYRKMRYLSCPSEGVPGVDTINDGAAWEFYGR